MIGLATSRWPDAITHQPEPMRYQFRGYEQPSRNSFEGQASWVDAQADHQSDLTMQRFLGELDDPFSLAPVGHHESYAWNFASDLSTHTTVQCDANGHGHHIGHRNGSTASSGFDSSYVDSSCSDRQASPYPSPALHGMPHGYSLCLNDTSFACGGPSYTDTQSTLTCVTMHDVQNHSERETLTPVCDAKSTDFLFYGTFPQEGYQTLYCGSEHDSEPLHQSQRTGSLLQDEEVGLTMIRDITQPVIRRRRVRRAHSSPSTSPASSSSRRPTRERRLRSQQHDIHAEHLSPVYVSATQSAAFPCPLAIYGCPSSFASKNEWKRHVNTQHMRLGFWRCDQCITPHNEWKPNDFNRKDLFTQHVRRMHLAVRHTPATHSKKPSKHPKDKADDEALKEAAARCYVHLRSPPEKCRCLFCDEQFFGKGAWDKRMEHIGGHMESFKRDRSTPTRPQDWNVDAFTEAWMVETRILLQRGTQLVLAH